MNEQITKKLLEYLQSTEDFVLEQAPEIMKQTLQYEKVSSFFCGILMFVLLVSAISVALYNYTHPKLNEYKTWEASTFFLVLVPCILVPIFFGCLVSSVDTLLKIYIAPKYYLIKLILSLKS